MNHKRKGPKSTRSGCLLCKPHKRQGVDAPTRQEQQGRDLERFYEEDRSESERREQEEERYQEKVERERDYDYDHNHEL